MADTQTAPDMDGSITSAQEALLGLLDSEEKPETEEATAEEEEISEASEEESDELEEDLIVDDESEETEDTQEDPQNLLYAVKVDGEEREITLDELLAGYSRQSSYTKKSQELSEQRKAFEEYQNNLNSELAQIQAERQHYVESLQRVIEGSAQALNSYQSINWEQLKADDPIEYVTKREEFRQQQEKVQAMQAQQAQAMQQAQVDAQRQHREAIQREHAKMVEALPEWGEPDKQREIADKIRSYAMSQGFEKEELDQLVDSRSLIVLRKAMQWEELQSADVKSKKLKNKPRVIRSGKGADKKQATKKVRNAQMSRLQKSGHVKDAASLFEDFVEM